MSIRKKIFLLAGILLALFGVVVGVLATMQKLDGEQINNIVSYELPLSRLVSEFDVDTDRYELNIMRVLRLNTAQPGRAQGGDRHQAGADRRAAQGRRRNPVAAAAGDPGSALPDRGPRRPGAHRRLVQIPRSQPRRISGRRRTNDGRACRRQARRGEGCLARLSRNSRRPSARTCRKSAAASPASPIAPPASCWRGSSSTPI